jgi:cbb3-type cytochrome c oxidase subunit III
MVDQTNSKRMHRISDERLISTIQEGEGHFMASWQGTLIDSEIADVASYVRLLPKLASQKSVEIAADPFEGRRLYRSYCLVCHGIEGNSTGPLADTLELEPADLSAAKYQRKKASELAVIIAGYRRTKESQMPRWGTVFPMTDLQNIAAYITLLTKDDLSLKGDRRRGRAIFKGACVACHGKFGRGKGILAQLINIPMIDFTDSKKMAQISDEELLSAIREGKGAFMASWKDTFNEAEIIDVASHVRSLAR